MRARRRSWLALIGLVCAAGAVGAQPAAEPRLRFDPFARPDLGTAKSASYAGTRAASEWSPVLTATLLAGPGSLANLGGVVLELGQETRGYRLVEVREFEAVFEHAGERVVLPVTAPRGGTR